MSFEKVVAPPGISRVEASQWLQLSTRRRSERTSVVSARNALPCEQNQWDPTTNAAKWWKWTTDWISPTTPSTSKTSPPPLELLWKSVRATPESHRTPSNWSSANRLTSTTSTTSTSGTLRMSWRIRAVSFSTSVVKRGAMAGRRGRPRHPRRRSKTKWTTYVVKL